MHYSRQIGLVKWYGGFNKSTNRKNDYGFIAAIDGMEVFVHESQIMVAQELEEDDLVAFDLGINPRNGKKSAANVKTLEDEVKELANIHTIDEIYEMLFELLNRIISHIELENESVPIANHVARRSIKKICEIVFVVNARDAAKRQSVATDFKDSLLEVILRLLAFEPTILQKLPTNFKKHPRLYNFLTDAEKFHVKVSSFLYEGEHETHVIDEIYRLATSDVSLRDQLPSSLKARQEFFELLDPVDKLNILVDRQVAQPSEMTIIEIAELVKSHSDLRHKLPQAMRQIEELLVCFEPREQVDIVWPPSQDSFPQYWKLLAWETRILCIYRSAYEDLNLYQYVTELVDEDNAFVKYALLILWAKFNPEQSHKAFLKAHNIFQDHICNIAWKSTKKKLNTGPLMPNCPMGVVELCEGRPWFLTDDTEGKKLPQQNLHKSARAPLAFCPRVGKGCRLNARNNYDGAIPEYLNHLTASGAHIYPLDDASWEKWTIHELLESANIISKIDELRNPREYVNRLAGWLNRLNDIRSRLKCSVCRKIMRPNYGYAKNLARYNVTIVSCNRGDGHDKDIYLNHCWGCERQIIDSRESSIQVEGFYLCIQCGSGPMRSDIYKQGDVCPKCGTVAMIVSGTHREFTCSNPACQHSISAPAKNKQTAVDVSDNVRIHALRSAVRKTS